MNIGGVLRSGARALSKPATLTQSTGFAVDPATGGHRATPETIDVKAHWTNYTESMKRAGMTQHPRMAHIVNDGAEPKPDDLLTINDQAMTIREVRSASEGAVWFVGGE